MTPAPPAVSITDTTLRDGSHAVAHRFTERQVRDVTAALDAAGVPVIEVTHGDGLGGSSFNYGFSRVPDVRLIEAAAEEARRAVIACLLLPGLGTVADLRDAYAAGARTARIATHCTEADVSLEHFEAARELGMDTVGFLMLSHRVSPAELAAQARVMVSAGCRCVHVVDSAGALFPDGVRDRVAALVDAVGDRADVGIHAHQNLSLGVANSLAAYEAGARRIDGTLCALGAGAGNAPTEVLAAVLERRGVPTGIDVPAILAAADEVVRPMIDRLPAIDRRAVVQGTYGVYSSFLLHAERAAARYGVPAHEILREVGEAGYVGGQEDMIIDVALRIAARQGAGTGRPATRGALA
ncbi:4-hydroxy-2-oxovalerate aldolase [Streptomyces liangshanensis]|uniref:4-hydroxy-2-oxovalerate aldolase n=1 Tax=Streptomyces liangshanensis TaxID=2717324 RepID=UPI0036DF1119